MLDNIGFVWEVPEPWVKNSKAVHACTKDAETLYPNNCSLSLKSDDPNQDKRKGS